MRLRLPWWTPAPSTRRYFGEADMLLGADFFLSHHVYVSQGQHRLCFTYDGGPVFQLDDRRPPPVSTAPPTNKA